MQPSWMLSKSTMSNFPTARPKINPLPSDEEEGMGEGEVASLVRTQRLTAGDSVGE